MEKFLFSFPLWEYKGLQPFVAVSYVGCAARTKIVRFETKDIGDNIRNGARSAPYDSRGF